MKGIVVVCALGLSGGLLYQAVDEGRDLRAQWAQELANSSAELLYTAHVCSLAVRNPRYLLRAQGAVMADAELMGGTRDQAVELLREASRGWSREDVALRVEQIREAGAETFCRGATDDALRNRNVARENFLRK